MYIGNFIENYVKLLYNIAGNEVKMDINTIWNSIVIIKIRRDDSYNFTLKEIETFAQVYDMDLEDFCINVLKLSKQQIYNLRNGNNDFVRSSKTPACDHASFEQSSENCIRRIKYLTSPATPFLP